MTSHAGPLVAPYANQLAFLRVSDDFWLKNKDPAAGNHTAHYEIVLSVCIARIFGHPGDPDRFKLENGIIPGLVSIPPNGSFFSTLTAVVSLASRMSELIS